LMRYARPGCVTEGSSVCGRWSVYGADDR